jgi:RNA polymerase sigma-70 factor (ECF subfamily)
VFFSESRGGNDYGRGGESRARQRRPRDGEATMKAAVRSCPPLSDEALAMAASGGDDDAFQELYARHADRVYARLTHLVGPGPDREDVLQQVFLELHRALPRFRGDSALATFLYRIAVHVAYDHLRRRIRRPAEHDPEALDALIDGDPTPESRTRCREQLRQIFGLLEHIKPKKRIAFVLVAVEGLSLAEAAELVGANAETVKQRVLHARHELIALIEDAERRAPRRPA